jgi:hypothetical protein
MLNKDKLVKMMQDLHELGGYYQDTSEGIIMEQVPGDVLGIMQDCIELCKTDMKAVFSWLIDAMQDEINGMRPEGMEIKQGQVEWCENMWRLYELIKNW